MREKNRSEIIHDALNLLDDEMIEEVEKLRGGMVLDKSPVTQEDEKEVQRKDEQKEFAPWRKWAALAASVCVFIFIGSIWHANSQLTEMQSEDQNENQEESKQEAMDIDLNSGTGLPFGDTSTDQLGSPEAEYCWAASVFGGENYESDKMKVGITDFAVRLFQQNIEQKNVLISPVSVLSSLGMTSFGAREETLSQMETVFGMSRGNLNRYLVEEINTTSSELNVANSIWFTNDENFTVEPSFFEFNKEFFQIDIFESSFDKEAVKDINAWVESKTNGAIKESLDEIPENVVMYLVNALLFEAEWETKYTELQIKDGIFTTQDGAEQQAEMMYSTEKLYLEDENASGFIKYYKNRDYAFVTLLPKEGISIYEYANTLTGEHLAEMLSNPKEAKVYSCLPQFSYAYGVEMQDVLKDMGMVDLFDANKADLTGLGVYKGRNIYVSRVIQKNFIQVTPVGTKAGAATVVEVPSFGAAVEQEEVKEVYLDRPFIYMIIDCENNLPVFIGVVSSVE